MELLDHILSAAGKLTATGILAVIVWAWVTGRVVTGRDNKDALADRDKLIAELRKDRDEWKTQALSYMQAVHRAVRAADPPDAPDLPGQPGDSVTHRRTRKPKP